MEKVISREYKVILRADAFAGGEQQLLTAAGEFWREFGTAIARTVLGRRGDLERISTIRTVAFYDTTARLLYTNSYIFRERQDVETREREVTLKFRHRDRYLSQDRNMRAADADDGKTKFEEDIKPVFETLYSFSTTQRISQTKNLNKLQDITHLYPGLAEKLADCDEDEAIEVVSGFTARELVIKGARFQLDKNPKLEGESGLILWYDHKGDDQKPVIAEFSFRYGDKDGEYHGTPARRAYEAFQILQAELNEWIDTDSKTKTAFVLAAE